MNARPWNGEITARVTRREGTWNFEGLKQMSAIGMSAAPRGKGFAISAYADIRHEQLFFERQQSLALRDMEWEGRIRPMTSWSG